MKLRLLCLALAFLLAVPSIPAQTATSNATAATAQVPRLIRLNGTLNLPPAPAGGSSVVNLTFSLYKDETGGTSLWQESQNVDADATGHYTVLLGTSQAEGLPVELFTSGQAQWLGVRPQGEAEQARIMLVSVPFALKAGDAETIGGLSPSAFVLANGSKGAAGSAKPATAATASNAARKPALPANPAVTGVGTVDFIPMWDTTSDIIDSIIFQKSSEIGIATTTPAATLDVNGTTDVRDTLTLYPKSTDNTLAINGTAFKIDQTGKVTFISGQTFPGTGTITGITTASGSGLAGGGTTGTLSLSVPAAGITNTMLKTSSLTVTAGTDLSGGGSVALGGTVTLNLNTTKVPLLASANKFTGNQTITGTMSATSSTAGVSAVSGTNSATTGVSYGVSGTSASSSGFGVSGSNSAKTGFTVGVSGTSASTSGFGVSGSNSAATGTTFGVSGTAASPSGVGVYGVNTAAALSPVGVWGVSNNSTTGVPAGVLGTTTSTTGVGVSGQSTATSGVSVGVSGTSASLSGAGVYGLNTATTGNAVGLWGQSNSTAGYGVYGTNSGSTGNGVVGYSSATSGTGWGVFGLSENSAGVAGKSNGGSGVYGHSTAANQDGVYAYSGGSGNSNGLYADTASGGGVGAFIDNAAGGYILVGTVFNNGVHMFHVDGGGNGFFAGNLDVSGAITAGSKDFKIDHPVDPANKYLVHASVESSEMMNIYTGNVTTDGEGTATVQLPEWFEALNRDFRYQLTVLGQFAQAIVADKVANHRFRIKTDKPNVEVSWQVTGIRHDAFANANRLQVEEEKSTADRGHYLHPELFGASNEARITQHSAPHKAPAEPSAARTSPVRAEQPQPMIPAVQPVPVVPQVAPAQLPILRK